jgi:ElaB/YqjD/DUF883 family membrane-anchored ribosome-binding protein
MKTLEEILDELKQLEQLLSSDSPIPEDEMQNVVNKLSSAFDLAHDELARVEQEVQILSTQTNQDEEERFRSNPFNCRINCTSSNFTCITTSIIMELVNANHIQSTDHNILAGDGT